MVGIVNSVLYIEGICRKKRRRDIQILYYGLDIISSGWLVLVF